MIESRWLLLAHQLPARLSSMRVKTWRRLQQVGAIPTRNAVYVLPNTEQCREDFEWIRSEIVALGGEATVFAADALSPGFTEELIGAFKKARHADYRALKREAARLQASRLKPSANRPMRRQADRVVRALRERFSGVQQIDFFAADGRQEAAEVLAALERGMTDQRVPDGLANRPLTPSDFQNRRWITRPRPGVDRMSSAWLIRRFIDPQATFSFADHPSGGAIAFDMYDGEFSHHGSLCTFETLAERFQVNDPVVGRIGQIVHDLDMKEFRYAAPDTPAVGRLVEGLRRLYSDDHALLEQGITMFEVLARSFDGGDERPARAPARKSRNAQPRSR